MLKQLKFVSLLQGKFVAVSTSDENWKNPLDTCIYVLEREREGITSVQTTVY